MNKTYKNETLNEIDKLASMYMRSDDLMLKGLIFAEIKDSEYLTNKTEKEIMDLLEIAYDTYTKYDYATPIGVGVSMCNYLWSCVDDSEDFNEKDFREYYEWGDWK